MNIGEKIKVARLRKGLTVKSIAAQLKVAESTFRDWENGRKIQGEPYLTLSKLLGIPLSELLGSTPSTLVQLVADIDLLDKQVKILKEHVLSLT